MSESQKFAQNFRDFLFGKQGYYNNLHVPVPPEIEALQKATNVFTYSGATSWFDPVYLGKLMLDGLTRSTKLFRGLRKTTYQSEGDSYQVIGTDAAEVMSILEAGTLFTAYDQPTITSVDKIYPAICKVDWINTEVAAALSQIQRSRTTPNLEQIRDYMSNVFLDRVEQQLAGVWLDPSGAGTGHGIDTPATSSGVATFECLDRMITSAEECSTTYLSAATDGNIFWDSQNLQGTSTVRFNRSAGQGVGQVKLPATTNIAAGEAFNICDELDDLMAKALVYAEEPYDYVCFMSPKAYNKVKAENDPKALITDYTDARQAVNGVTSTPGVAGGKVQLSALRLSDITVPIVTVPYLMGTAASGWLWKNTDHTTGGVGNIYLVNQNSIEFRILIPITYRAVQAENSLATKHTLYMAGQLIAKNWASNAALKYIAS